jgi:hypothetical protein
MDNTDLRLAALERVRICLQDLVDTARGSDTEDSIGSLLHLIKEAEDSLEVLAVLEGPDEVLDPEDVPDEDDAPPECELCEGQGFGNDAEGAVACPQCNGTGVQPENVRAIDDELGLDD